MWKLWKKGIKSFNTIWDFCNYKHCKLYDKHLHTFQEKILMKSENKILLGIVLFCEKAKTFKIISYNIII
jgi:hypothetical protein